MREMRFALSLKALESDVRSMVKNVLKLSEEDVEKAARAILEALNKPGASRGVVEVDLYDDTRKLAHIKVHYRRRPGRIEAYVNARTQRKGHAASVDVFARKKLYPREFKKVYGKDAGKVTRRYLKAKGVYFKELEQLENLENFAPVGAGKWFVKVATDGKSRVFHRWILAKNIAFIEGFAAIERFESLEDFLEDWKKRGGSVLYFFGEKDELEKFCEKMGARVQLGRCGTLEAEDTRAVWFGDGGRYVAAFWQDPFHKTNALADLARKLGWHAGVRKYLFDTLKEMGFKVKEDDVIIDVAEGGVLATTPQDFTVKIVITKNGRLDISSDYYYIYHLESFAGVPTEENVRRAVAKYVARKLFGAGAKRGGDEDEDV
ncbi:MAG: hypothetical protein QW650_00140 [Thermofilum sp.]